MAIMRIFTDQIKRCHHEENYGGASFEWYDVTNDASAILSKYDEPDPANYDREDFLQFRIPATALTGFNINSVKLFVRATSVNRTIPIYVYVKDYDEFESGASSIVTDSIAAAGWSDTDISSLFSALAGKNAVWYVQTRVGAVTQDVSYEAYINTLNGDYDPYIEIDYTPDTCVAPTLATLAAVAETDPTLSGSGASGDHYGNEITGYEIQTAESADGETWGGWVAEKTVDTSETAFSTSVAISPTRGNTRKWRVRTLGEAGASYYSDWVETGAIRRNSIPSAPASVSASPAIYESGGVVISWPAAADPDNNVAAYELQRAASADGVTWGGWVDVVTNITALQYTDTPSIARGEYVKYRVRAKDAFGITGEYAGSAAVRRNQVPPAVTINYPQTGKTTYNSRPRMLITLGTDPDGQTQTLTATGYTTSNPGPYASGQRLVLCRTSAAAAGGISATITPKDAQNAEGAPSAIGMTYAALSLAEPITAGVTRVKASHINELRAAVDTVRSYYGLSAYNWAETITAGRTSARGWTSHISELRMAIDEIVALVNGWDTAAVLNQIDVPAWLTVGIRPPAAVLNQIRTILPTL